MTVLLMLFLFSLPLVPPPVVLVEPVNRNITMVAGTARDLTCTITLTNADDINVMVNFTWSTPMGMLLSSSPRITISGTTQSGNQSTFTSTLSFSPLDSVVDTTMFSCLVSVNSDPTDSFIIPTAANSSVDITVLREHLCMITIVNYSVLLFSNLALSRPTMIITSSGTMSPGSSITLTCIVGVVQGLIVQPGIVWTKQAVSAGGDTALNTISVPPVRTNNTVTLTFNPTNTSDAGQYTCTATVDISAINVTVSNYSMVDIRLQSEWVTAVADEYFILNASLPPSLSYCSPISNCFPQTLFCSRYCLCQQQHNTDLSCWQYSHHNMCYHNTTHCEHTV